MPLKLVPAVEADLEQMNNIEFVAFNTTSPLGPVLHPNGNTEKVQQEGTKRHRETFSAHNSIYWKVVDTDLDSKPIAFAIWRVYRQEDLAKSIIGHPLAEVEGDVNMDILRMFEKGAVEVKKRTIADKERVHLTLLCTLPEHQRRGAGTMLLEKGAEIADKERLPTSLIGNILGVPLYRKVGFKEVENGDWVMDLRLLGRTEIITNKVMWRPLDSTAI